MNQDLINRAQELRNHGFTTGEIADELNVSMDTAQWLTLQRKEELTSRCWTCRCWTPDRDRI